MLSARCFRFAVPAFGLLVGLAPVSVSHAGQASEKERCLQSYDQAQTLRQADKLMASREELLVCARAVCPTVIRKDCIQWLAEVEESLPTVVIEASKPDGRDAVSVRVTVDGKPFLDEIDGKAVPLDPGVHTFRFELEGAKPIEERIVIYEGVKNRRVRVSFESDAPEPEPSVAPPPSPPPSEPVSHGPPALAWVLGGLGIAGLGGFAALGLQFDSKLNDLDKCEPLCSQSDVDSASMTRTLALVSGGVGVVSLGVATYLFVRKPDTESSAPSSSVDVIAVPGGWMGGVRGRF